MLNGKKTAGMNARSVGISAVGNFEANHMNDKQKEAIKRVVRDVARYYDISDIKGHNEAAGPGYTDCPGRYYPLDEVKVYVLQSDAPPPEVMEPTPDEEYPPTYKVVVGDLNFQTEPSTKSKVIRMLHRGDLVKLDRYVKGEDWARVIVNGVIGWVWLSYIGEQ